MFVDQAIEFLLIIVCALSIVLCLAIAALMDELKRFRALLEDTRLRQRFQNQSVIKYDKRNFPKPTRRKKVRF